MTREEAIRIATGLRTDFKCESDTMVDFCNTIIKALEQEPILDKIRAEIEGMTPTYHNADWSITDLVPISEVLKFIDKYRTESEVQDADCD